MTNPQQRLKETLIANGDTRENADSLSHLSIMLDAMPQPAIQTDHQQSVLAAMLTELPLPKTRYEQITEWYPVALLLSQVRIIHRGLWAASAVILTLGVIVTLLSPDPDFSLLTMVAPVVAAGSLALLYDDTVRSMLEIEDATRASARLLLLARMTLVFGFNLVLALTGSIVLALFDSQMLLLPLIMSWLAPMTFLAGLAFFLSIAARDTLFAMSVSLVLWIAHLATRADSFPNIWFHALSMPGLSDPSNRPFLLLSGVTLMGIALWMVGILDRQTGHIA